MSRFIESVSPVFEVTLKNKENVKMVTVTRGDTTDNNFVEHETVEAGSEFDPTPSNKNYNAVADKE